MYLWCSNYGFLRVRSLKPRTKKKSNIVHTVLPSSFYYRLCRYYRLPNVLIRHRAQDGDGHGDGFAVDTTCSVEAQEEGAGLAI